MHYVLSGKLGRLIGGTIIGGCMLMAAGCEPRYPTSGGAEAVVPVRITAVTVGTPINTLVVQVTASDIPTALVFNLTVSNGVASGTIRIPPGPGRTVDVTAFDAAGNITHEGSALVDVRPGQNPPLTIKLAPRSGHVPITVTFGNFSVVVTPASPTIDAILATQLQLAVTVTDVNGQAVSGPEVGWATTDPTVATVDGQGLVTAAANGTASIVATFEGVAGLSTVNVTGVGGPLPPSSFTGTWSLSPPPAMSCEIVTDVSTFLFNATLITTVHTSTPSTQVLDVLTDVMVPLLLTDGTVDLGTGQLDLQLPFNPNTGGFSGNGSFDLTVDGHPLHANMGISGQFTGPDRLDIRSIGLAISSSDFFVTPDGPGGLACGVSMTVTTGTRS